MSSRPSRPAFAPTRPDLVVPVRTDRRGLRGPTAGQARGPFWRTTSRGLHVPAHVPLTREQRIVEAAATLPEYGAVTGWAGLAWQGGRWFTGQTVSGLLLPIELASLGHAQRRQPGLQVVSERLRPADIMEVDGLRVTIPVRSVAFMMRRAGSVWRAARIFAMAAYNDLVSTGELLDYVAELNGWTGVPRCRGAFPFLRENCWSPLEVWMSLVWQCLAGQAAPLCNQPLFDADGRHVGTPDLFDLVAGVAGEYNGALHDTERARARDVEREECYRDLGLECVVATSADLGRRDALAMRIRAAYARAAVRPNGSWTIDMPPWWVATQTVQQRRALDDAERAIWLRYRAA